MTRVRAIILHPLPGPDAGPLVRVYAAMREANARRLLAVFASLADEATVLEVESGGTTFGETVRTQAGRDPDAGLVVLGSGSVPLASASDLAIFVAAARATGGAALANNRYSADIVALPAGAPLAALPDLTADNSLPRWLEEHGLPVRDVRGRTRLQIDLDSPLDGILLAAGGVARSALAAALQASSVDAASVRHAVEGIRAIAGDPRAELLVAGRASAATLRWLERRTASRTRALIEERGLRTARSGQRVPRSVLGSLLDIRGAAALGAIVAELADAAVIDSRVLLAHRLGADERSWPDAEDRFASDLLADERVRDPWLRELTRSAREGGPPILLVGHTLIGPGLPIVLGAPLAAAAPASAR